MDNSDSLFVQLLFVFHQNAMQGMGKIKNPLTDKIERNLEQAKHSIEMMEMMKEKTRGNIAEEVSKMLDGFLTELRLNYVEESSKG